MQAPANFISSLTIPTGATTGQRITFNAGNDGMIKIYNSSNKLVGKWGGTLGRFFVGVDLNDVTQPLVELDPSDLGLLLGGGGPSGFQGAFIAWDNFVYTTSVKMALTDSTNTTVGTMFLAPGANNTLAWVAGDKLTPTYAANFAGGGFGQDFEVWVDDNDCLRVTGCFQATAAIASGTVAVTTNLGGAPSPVNTTNLIGMWTSSSNVGKGTVQVRINSNGTITVASGGLTSGDRVFVNGFVPLGNV